MKFGYCYTLDSKAKTAIPKTKLPGMVLVTQTSQIGNPRNNNTETYSETRKCRYRSIRNRNIKI